MEHPIDRAGRNVGRCWPPRRASFQELEPRPSNLNLCWGVRGEGERVGRLPLPANVLVPFTDAGLKRRVTAVVGVDVAFCARGPVPAVARARRFARAWAGQPKPG